MICRIGEKGRYPIHLSFSLVLRLLLGAVAQTVAYLLLGALQYVVLPLVDPCLSWCYPIVYECDLDPGALYYL